MSTETTETQEKVTLDQQSTKFKSMLRLFDTIIHHESKDTEAQKKEKLESLKEMVNVSILTERQKDAVYGRCQNYINGTYGVDNKKSTYMKENP